MELKANVNFDRFEAALQVVDAHTRVSSAVWSSAASRSQRETP